MDIVRRIYSMTDIITESFNVFWKNISGLFILQFMVLSTIILMLLPPFLSLHKKGMFKEGVSPEVLVEQLFSTPGFVLFLGLVFVVYVVLFVLQKAAVAIYIKERVLGNDIGVLGALKEGAKRALPLVGTLFFTGLLAALPFACVPLFISLSGASEGAAAAALLTLMGLMMIMFFLIFWLTPLVGVVVLKKKSFKNALFYCIKLVKTVYWPTVGFWFLLFAIVFALTIAAGIVNTMVQISVLFIGSVFSETQAVMGVLMVILFLAALIINMIPNCYIDVPLTLYYINREAFFGDQLGDIADQARSLPSGTGPLEEADVNLMPATVRFTAEEAAALRDGQKPQE